MLGRCHATYTKTIQQSVQDTQMNARCVSTIIRLMNAVKKMEIHSTQLRTGGYHNMWNWYDLSMRERRIRYLLTDCIYVGEHTLLEEASRKRDGGEITEEEFIDYYAQVRTISRGLTERLIANMHIIFEEYEAYNRAKQIGK